jgi:hypothetical protein
MKGFNAALLAIDKNAKMPKAYSGLYLRVY